MKKSKRMSVFQLVLIIVFLLLSITLAGCASGSKAANENPTPEIIEIPDNYDHGYKYLVDRRTGVVYLSYEGAKYYGMTVMLNTDGTPVTADQLGIEYEPIID